MLIFRCPAVSRPTLPLLQILILGMITWLAASATSFGTSGKWDELIGKKVLNYEGDTLGYVTGSAVDLERGRYVGMLVSFGGFLGIGEKTKIVPPGALVDAEMARSLLLNMSPTRFHDAPTFKLSGEVGPPSAVAVAKVYEYFGQQPYFTTAVNSPMQDKQKLEPLGYVLTGAGILNLPVDNLQGIQIGVVVGLRDLNRETGRLGGVVIAEEGEPNRENYKIIAPEDLRYNLTHNRLRINNHQQPFRDTPEFKLSSTGSFEQENTSRPGTPPPPLTQGNSERDKAITLKIREAILSDSTLSHYAQQIEVATVKGKTLVRGRVEREEGRRRVIAYATAAAGRGNVQEQIVVKRMSQTEANIDTDLDRR